MDDPRCELMKVTDKMIEVFGEAWNNQRPRHAGDRRRAGLEAVFALITTTANNEDELSEILASLNFDDGIEPVVIGFDSDGRPFLAYGWAPGGDGWDAGFVYDDTHSSEFSIEGVRRCEECGAFERQHISRLRYPVVLVTP
jgi:hypothetical protein